MTIINGDDCGWGFIPQAPAPTENKKRALEKEREVLPRLRQAQGGACLICDFPAMKALRGIEVHNKWIGVCPVCLAALDLTRAPPQSTIIYLPEYSPVEFSKLLNTFFLWIYNPDGDYEKSDTGWLEYQNLEGRGEHVKKLFSLSQYLTTDQLCKAFWELGPNEVDGFQRLMPSLRVMVAPEHIISSINYWKKHVYPNWRP